MRVICESRAGVAKGDKPCEGCMKEGACAQFVSLERHLDALLYLS
jgi:hypothetical protein